jgi:NADPH:quinone reductase-like Zn-dependent oxidoreductase
MIHNSSIIDKKAKIGKKVKIGKINQKVCALVHGGGYAEYCKVFYKHVLPIPKGMSFIEAAAVPVKKFSGTAAASIKLIPLGIGNTCL